MMMIAPQLSRYAMPPLMPLFRFDKTFRCFFVTCCCQLLPLKMPVLPGCRQLPPIQMPLPPFSLLMALLASPADAADFSLLSPLRLPPSLVHFLRCARYLIAFASRFSSFHFTFSH
jgi:hypothetical protein